MAKSDPFEKRLAFHLAYAQRRERELMAEGKTVKQAWGTIMWEIGRGMPERENQKKAKQRRLTDRLNQLKSELSKDDRNI